MSNYLMNKKDHSLLVWLFLIISCLRLYEYYDSLFVFELMIRQKSYKSMFAAVLKYSFVAVVFGLTFEFLIIGCLSVYIYTF